MDSKNNGIQRFLVALANQAYSLSFTPLFHFDICVKSLLLEKPLWWGRLQPNYQLPV